MTTKILSIAQVLDRIPWGRNRLYRDIEDGLLVTFTHGPRRFTTEPDVEAYLARVAAQGSTDFEPLNQGGDRRSAAVA